MTKSKFYFLLTILPLHFFGVRYIMDINKTEFLQRTISIGRILILTEQVLLKTFIKDICNKCIKDKMDAKNNKNQEINKQISYNSFNLKTVSFFRNDVQIIFIFKKTERLASAIYLLTSFLSDIEPIKWKMRDAVTRLLSYSINLSNQGHYDNVLAMNNFTAASLEIVSLLEIADISGIISAMNCKIIKFEIEKIIELIELKEKGLNDKLFLSKNFFEIPKEEYSGKDDMRERAGLDLIEHKKSVEQNLDKERTFEKDLYDKGHVLIKDTGIEEKTSASFNKGHIVKDKNKRYEVIMNLLKKTKEIRVKDVSNMISDYSEKTIQRELLSLVDKGILKKEGERRWSKYSLAL